MHAAGLPQLLVYTYHTTQIDHAKAKPLRRPILPLLSRSSPRWWPPATVIQLRTSLEVRRPLCSRGHGHPLHCANHMHYPYSIGPGLQCISHAPLPALTTASATQAQCRPKSQAVEWFALCSIWRHVVLALAVIYGLHVCIVSACWRSLAWWILS